METTLQENLVRAIQAQVPTELKHCAISNDAAIVQALKTPRINQATDEDLKKALRYVMLLVGIRAKNIPVDEEKIVLLNYIRKYFGMYTIQELKLAFEFAINGELNLKPEEVNCYDNFAPHYVAKILKAYSKISSVTIDFHDRKYEEAKALPIPENFKTTDMVDMYYQEFLQGKLKLQLVTEKAYDVAANKCGLKIPDQKLLELIQQAKDFILDGYKRKIQSLSVEKELGYYNELMRKRDDLKKMHVGVACKNDDVNHYAKALCLHFWFDEQKNKGVKKIV